jgi:hypothetical protein
MALRDWYSIMWPVTLRVMADGGWRMANGEW